MTDTLASAKVAAVLNRLFTSADAGDPDLLARIQREADERFGGQRYAPELSPLFDQAYLPVPAEVGRFLYVLTRAKHPKCIVEIGTSFGVSAIHFACALKDNGEGRLISAELSRAKSEAAANNLVSLGLGNFVEMRCGNAFETLRAFSGNIDLLNRRIEYRGFAPRLSLIYVLEQSSIGLYRFSRFQAQVGITRQF